MVAFVLLFSQVEAAKADMTTFFSGHVEALASMRETAVQGFTSLQAEHGKLKEQINQAGSRHTTVRLFSSPRLICSPQST